MLTLVTRNKFVPNAHFLLVVGKIGSQIVVPYRGDPYIMKDLKVAGDLGQVITLVRCYSSFKVLGPRLQNALLIAIIAS